MTKVTIETVVPTNRFFADKLGIRDSIDPNLLYIPIFVMDGDRIVMKSDSYVYQKEVVAVFETADNVAAAIAMLATEYPFKMLTFKSDIDKPKTDDTDGSK
jgi:hypothetical protein